MASKRDVDEAKSKQVQAPYDVVIKHNRTDIGNANTIITPNNPNNYYKYCNSSLRTSHTEYKHTTNRYTNVAHNCDKWQPLRPTKNESGTAVYLGCLHF